MVRLLQFLAFILLLRFVWRAVVRLTGEPEVSRVRGGAPGERKTIYRGQMVRDPVCGVYIPEQGSLVERRSGETYHFCTCGHSATQPFCDGSHGGTGFRPQAFTAEKDGKAFLCQCKHTANAPFCDGSHGKLS